MGTMRLVALAMLGGVTVGAYGQMPVPRYQSTVDAPVPQATLPVPAAITPNGSVVEDVVVRVNDQIIDRSDMERAEKQLAEEIVQTKMSRADQVERQKNLLRDMIDQQLLLSRAKELGINADTQVTQQLNEIRKKNNLPTMEALEKAVRDSGTSYEDFKANIRNSIMTNSVVRDEVQRHMQLTPKEEQAYYDAHKQEYEQPEQVHLSEILIPTPADPTDAMVAQAQAKANDVAAKLKAGAKFEDLAKEYSGGPTADKGGDLGAFKRGQLAKVLEDETFPLAVGESTAPIRTRQGFVVLKVTAHDAAGVPPLKDIEDQVQEAVYREAIQPALRAYLTKLREEAYIDIAAGFVDSGASAKETKIVNSAYAPPTVKKKTVAQKQRLERSKATTAIAGTSGTAKPASSTSAASVKTVSAPGKKPKKIRKEKIRFGQAPRLSLPESPEEAAATVGSDTGAGATPGSLPAPGALLGTNSTSNVNLTANADPLGPPAQERRKTRYSARVEAPAAKGLKSAKAKEKAAAAPSAMTAEEKAAQRTQSAPLGLNGDTASKKKRVKVKGAPKERLQDKAPAPVAAKPDATPIPPKSVRENGEPVVTPAPGSNQTMLPPVTAPAPGAPAGGAQTSPTPVGGPGATPLAPGTTPRI
jgi:peptidyl-prolyl cis-trans isomerase SurA